MVEKNEWQPHVPLFQVTLATGERMNGLVMRRRIGWFRWEYRRPTSDEEAEYVSAGAW
jgi:hypothetical protein